ncbi:Recombination protein U [Dethiosulfovibrio salsuginis]|uniref:Holliday junction resolvase RecU n=1 Tax=Dethiosulfovibrio salsuginis TaxID=561720 RepID=A0A1X7KIX6_9BACT|nr:Holliday junction resolvase RecU [Dethiosulfovibrio sp.]SMG40921.1 Recombination protein U [Dethiosulfovibrio salsuginis]
MARRGYRFEHEIDRVIAYLGSCGIHGHKNHARRTVDGVFLEGEPFDYEVFSNGKLHCFDAKESKTARWSLKNAKPAQVNALIQCANHGAEAYFLVHFEGSGVRRFDAEQVKAAMAAGKTFLTADEGRPWDWEELTGSRGSRKNTA